MPCTRALLPLTLAATLALAACGSDGDDTPAEETAAEEEQSASEDPTAEEEDGEEDEDAQEFAMPEDCDSSGAEAVAMDVLPADTEQITDEEDDSGFRCGFASQESESGIQLTYSEGFTMADMPDIEDNYEAAGENADRDLYMTDRVNDLGGVLEGGDIGDVDGHSATLHLPGGVYISGMTVGTDMDKALTEDELDDVLADAAEALL